MLPTNLKISRNNYCWLNFCNTTGLVKVAKNGCGRDLSRVWICSISYAEDAEMAELVFRFEMDLCHFGQFWQPPRSKKLCTAAVLGIAYLGQIKFRVDIIVEIFFYP